MARRSKPRSESDGDAVESLKPLVVLVLLGTILYGAWSVVNKGPSGGPPDATPAGTGLSAAPPFAPQVELPPTPAAQGPLAVAAATTPQPPAIPPPAAAAPAPVVDAPPTYLNAVPAAPPTADPLAASPGAAAAAPGFPSLPPLPPAVPATEAPAPARVAEPGQPPRAAFASEPSQAAAFAAAWADAHDKLAAGRYPEALAVLSKWHDDPSLGLEESQRLDDLLGQLAGTVIYSQQDLLLPAHVVQPGESLATIAAPLAVPWPLLAKINGITDPGRLVPGEAIKLVRGPFHGVVSVSRRRLSLRLGDALYAGTFPALVGRQFRDRVGSGLPVVRAAAGNASSEQPAEAQVAWSPPGSRAITLGEGFVIEGVPDLSALSPETIPGASLIVAERDLAELADILGPGSQVVILQ